jgi:hypothetical protein
MSREARPDFPQYFSAAQYFRNLQFQVGRRKIVNIAEFRIKTDGVYGEFAFAVHADSDLRIHHPRIAQREMKPAHPGARVVYMCKSNFDVVH